MRFQACPSGFVTSVLSTLLNTSTLVTGTTRTIPMQLTVPTECGKNYKLQVTRFSPAFCYVFHLGSIYPLLFKINNIKLRM